MNQKSEREREFKRRSTVMLLFLGTLAVISNIEGIKNAHATGEMIMGQSNDASTQATELKSSNYDNTLKVVEYDGHGHAIHAVNNGNFGDAVHGWAKNTAGSGVYGESNSSMDAGVTGVGNNAPGGDFRISDTGAYYQHRGAIHLDQQSYLTNDCMGGDLAVYKGDLYFCRFVSGTNTSPLWKKVTLQP